ncbi:MAG: rhamnulokinase [Promethearchaeota archaeon]
MKNNVLKNDYIAIDLGASSGRVILGSLQKKDVNSLPKISYKIIHRFPTGELYLFNTMRWNILRFWEEILAGLKKISILNNLNIKGIGVDSWGVNLVYLTKDLELACQPFHYRDSLINDGEIYMRKLFDMKKVYEITGIQEINLNGLVHLCGLKTKYPEILKRTHRICMIPDYFNYLLTGKLCCEYTNATTTQLLDAAKKDWSEYILKNLGLKKEVFPPIHQPGTKLSSLDPSVQRQCGLKDIDVFVVASHDTASAVISVPIEMNSNEIKPNECAYLSSGTWSLLGVEINKPIITEKGRKLNFTNEGGAFGTIRYLKNIMGLWLLQKSKAIWDEELKKGKSLELNIPTNDSDKENINEPIREISYAMISEEAKKYEPKRSIIAVDDSAFFNPPNMIKAIQNYCEKTNQPIPKSVGEIARCIYDSLAIRYKEVIQMLETALNYKIKRLYIVGGGSQDKLLNQITANELGIEVFAGPVEATAIGNIMIQAYANKFVSNLAEIREIIRNSFEIEHYKPEN